MKRKKTGKKQLPAEQTPGTEAEQEEYVISCGGIQPFGLYDLLDGEEEIPGDEDPC